MCFTALILNLDLSFFWRKFSISVTFIDRFIIFTILKFLEIRSTIIFCYILLNWLSINRFCSENRKIVQWKIIKYGYSLFKKKFRKSWFRLHADLSNTSKLHKVRAICSCSMSLKSMYTLQFTYMLMLCWKEDLIMQVRIWCNAWKMSVCALALLARAPIHSLKK